MRKEELYEKLKKGAIKKIHAIYKQQYQINQTIKEDMCNDYNDEKDSYTSFQDFIDENAIQYDYVIELEDNLTECEGNVSYMLYVFDQVNDAVDGRCPTSKEVIEILENEFLNNINETNYSDEIKKQLVNLFKNLMNVWSDKIDKNTYLKEYMETFNS